MDFGAPRQDPPRGATAGRDDEAEPSGGDAHSSGQGDEAPDESRYGWGSAPEEDPSAPHHGRADGPDRTDERRGTGGEAASPTPTTAPAPSGHPEQGSAFSLALKFPFSRGWRTVGAWSLAFWGVLVALAVVAVASSEATGTVRVTTGTLATAVLVLGPLPFLGYLLRLCRAAARGDERAPAFEGLRANAALGVRALAGLFALQFLVALPFLPIFLLSGGEPGPALSLALALAAIGGSLLLGYLFPAFLTIIAVTGSLREAFGTRRVADFAFTTEYFVASLIGFVLLIVLRLLAVLSVLTLVGWIVVVPYSFVAVAAYWGEVYRDHDAPAGAAGAAVADD
jgi:hypothetical protein